MNTIGVVFAAEFERRVRSRAFLIGTVVGALCIVGIALLPTLFNGITSSSKNVVLVGEPRLTAAAADALKGDFTVTARETRLSTTPTLKYLDAHGKAEAVAVIEQHGNTLHVTAYTRDPGSLHGAFTRDLSTLQLRLATGMTDQRIKSLMNFSVDEHDVAGKFADASQANAAKGIAYVFVTLLYLAILFNAQTIVMAVAEEKTSRIAELLISTVDPARLLFAKVLATTATGSLQLAVWLTAATLTSKAVAAAFADTPREAAAAAASGMGVSAPEILWFIVFFIVGFAQCAVLFAAAGSLVNRSEDVGGMAGPLYVPVVGAIIIAQFALQYPSAPNIVTFSFIPLIAPFVMFTRVVVSTVPVWQLVLSLTINVAAAICFAWLAGRVYRVGLLMYGRLPSLSQVVAAMRA